MPINVIGTVITVPVACPSPKLISAATPIVEAACGFSVVNDLIRAGLLQALHDGRWVSLR